MKRNIICYSEQVTYNHYLSILISHFHSHSSDLSASIIFKNDEVHLQIESLQIKIDAKMLIQIIICMLQVTFDIMLKPIPATMRVKFLALRYFYIFFQNNLILNLYQLEKLCLLLFILDILFANKVELIFFPTNKIQSYILEQFSFR